MSDNQPHEPPVAFDEWEQRAVDALFASGEAEFAGKPHVWIQWKGTDACLDLRCECGCVSHFDGFFLYSVICRACGNDYAIKSHIGVAEIDDNENT